MPTSISINQNNTYTTHHIYKYEWYGVTVPRMIMCDEAGEIEGWRAAEAEKHAIEYSRKRHARCSSSGTSYKRQPSSSKGNLSSFYPWGDWTCHQQNRWWHSLLFQRLEHTILFPLYNEPLQPRKNLINSSKSGSTRSCWASYKIS